MTNRSREILRAALPLLLLLAFAPRARAQGSAQQQATAPPAESQQGQEQTGTQSQVELMRALNLTPEQRAQIAQIRRETEEQAAQLNFRLRRARRALEQAIYSEHADESAIQQRTKEVADAEAARAQMRTDAELKVRRVLTPEQLSVFREMRRQAQQARQRQNALNRANNTEAAQRPAARAQQRNQTQQNGAQPRPNNKPAPVPNLFPRRQRPPARKQAPRP